MGNLFTARVGNILTALMGNVLTARVGKVLVIYIKTPDPSSSPRPNCMKNLESVGFLEYGVKYSGVMGPWP